MRGLPTPGAFSPRRGSRSQGSRPRRRVAAWLLGSALLVVPPLLAQAQGSAASTEEQASAAFEAAANALKAKDYQTAALQFETAHELLPSAEALRGAIRARSRAGHGARAATLAAQGMRLFPDTNKLVKAAEEALAEFGPGLHGLEVTCSQACSLAIDGHRVPGAPSKEARLYLDPGKHTIAASFPDGSGADQQLIVAKAGGKNSIHFMSRSSSAAPTGTSAERPSPEPTGTASDPGPGPASASSTEADVEPDPGEAPTVDAAAPWDGWSPAVFFVTLGVTAVLGGVTIWSGVDTLNNPGQDVVRQRCQGLGTDCPEYQDGLAKQVRTNALIGVTAGVGALTAIVGLFLTDWTPDEPAEPGVALVPGSEGEVAVRARF
jgi:hypothetical protein